METIIYDFGGVLIDWNPRYVFTKVFETTEEVDYFLSEVCDGAWNAEQDRGRSFESAIEMKQKEFPEYHDVIPLYFSRWTEMIGGEIKESVDLLEELYKSGKYRLYGLTNWSSQTFPYAWENFEFLRLFEGIVVSGREKLIKPEPGIYDLILNRYDIEASKAVFIDDSIKNVIAATEQGINGVHFTDAKALRKELIGMGIDLSS